MGTTKPGERQRSRFPPPSAATRVPRPHAGSVDVSVKPVPRSPVAVGHEVQTGAVPPAGRDVASFSGLAVADSPPAPAHDPRLAVGLSSAEAAARLATDGPNRIPAGRRVPVWRRFVNQLIHFFALLLWVAGILAFVAGLPELGIAIFLVILVNGTFAFAQEFPGRARR